MSEAAPFFVNIDRRENRLYLLLELVNLWIMKMMPWTPF